MKNEVELIALDGVLDGARRVRHQGRVVERAEIDVLQHIVLGRLRRPSVLVPLAHGAAPRLGRHGMRRPLAPPPELRMEPNDELQQGHRWKFRGRLVWRDQRAQPRVEPAVDKARIERLGRDPVEAKHSRHAGAQPALHQMLADRSHGPEAVAGLDTPEPCAGWVPNGLLHVGLLVGVVAFRRRYPRRITGAGSAR